MSTTEIKEEGFDVKQWQALNTFLKSHPQYFMTRYQVNKLAEAGSIPTDCYMQLQRLERVRFMVHIERFDKFIRAMAIAEIQPTKKEIMK